MQKTTNWTFILSYQQGWALGKPIFFYSSQIANAQILWLILLSQIRKFLSFACVNPQNANPQIIMINPQIFQNTAQLCLKTVLRVVLRKRFFYFVQFRIKALYANFAACESF